MTGRIRILCVDDEKSILAAIKRSFWDDDFEILNATSGPEGLEMLRRVTPIQVVISDFRMPEMNGVDFLKEVCKCWPETVRIVISGHADTGAIISAINDGQITKFIPKPWKNDDMKAAVSASIKQYCYHQEHIHLAQELRRKEGQLQRLTDRLGDFEKIFFSCPVALMLVDLDGVIIHCNDEAKELLGKDGQDLTGKNQSDFLPNEINAFIKSLIRGEALSEQCSIGPHLFRIKGSLIREREKEAVILTFDRLKEGLVSPT